MKSISFKHRCIEKINFLCREFIREKSFFILSKEGINDNELQVAEAALFLFVENFQTLYGERFMTLNVHQLVHLTDCVRHTGPLYVNNCFIFEDLNGFIVKHIHGTQGVDVHYYCVHRIINSKLISKVLQSARG